MKEINEFFVDSIFRLKSGLNLSHFRDGSVDDKKNSLKRDRPVFFIPPLLKWSSCV